MKIEIKNKADIIKVQTALFDVIKDIENGKTFDCEIKEHREKRSKDANAYFHLLVNKIAGKIGISDFECKVNMNLQYGTIATDEQGNAVVVKLPSSVDIKQFYNYAKFIGEKTENGLALSYYTFYKQTHTLNTKEMARLIDGVVFEAQQLDIETKTPEEIAELKSLWASEKNGE